MTKLRTTEQRIKREATWTENGLRCRLVAEIRHDDTCRNGHNTFAITGTLYENGRDVAGGCLHTEIAERFPDLAPYIKWHLTSTDGPMHYIANTLYHLGYTRWKDSENLAHARSTAVWPDMPESFLASQGGDKAEVQRVLESRLAGLLADFRAAVESLGLEY